MNLVLNSLGIPANEEEFLWRRLLWLNRARYLPYDHTPYGDDAEMQCCGIDFKRQSAAEIDSLLLTRSLRHQMEMKKRDQ